MTTPKFLTVADIAALIGWSTERTRRWLRRRGVLPPVKSGNREWHIIPRDKLLELQESASILDFDGLPGDDYLR